MNGNAIVPVGLPEIERMAKFAVQSKLFGAKEESQAVALMLVAQAEGLHPMTAVQEFDVIQGRPARKTHSILARFQQAGGSVAWEEVSQARACGVFSHRQGGSLRVEWTIDQAKRIGLTGKDNWKNYPQAMLRARCIAEGVRAVFPGAIGGMLAVEEAQDFVAAPPRDMGAVEQVPQGPSSELMALAEVAADSGTEAFRAYWKQLPKPDREALESLVPVLKERAQNADNEAPVTLAEQG